MSMLHRPFLTAAFVSVMIFAQGVSATDPLAVTVEPGVAIKMRDGTLLRADIYRPKTEGTFPVLLQRTPYDKTGSSSFSLRAAARGYVVIVQDVRGRYTS